MCRANRVARNVYIFALCVKPAWGSWECFSELVLFTEKYFLLLSHLLALTGALYVIMCYYPSTQLSQIFTQSIDAIDVTSVTLC